MNQSTMLAFEIVRQNRIMAARTVATTGLYVTFVPFLLGYFDFEFIDNSGFARGSQV